MTGSTTVKTDGAQILIVDDTLANLKLLMEILTGRGYRVRPASDARLALKSVAAETPELILLDVRMPDMDGYEICRHLKSSEKTHGIPVIFISALNDTSDKIKGFNAGGVDYITKPFDSTEVLARVETHLALGRMQKRIEAQNLQLQTEIMVRRQTEEELRNHKVHLEELVEKRTAELKKSNEELKREVAERKEAEKTLRSLINSAPIGIFVLQNGKFKLVNPGFEKTTGYSENELIGRDSLFLVASEFKTTIRDKSIQMLKERCSTPYEYRIVNKNGGTNWVVERVTSIQFAGEKAVLGYFMDITARKMAEETLKASKARISEMLNQ